MKNHLRRKRRSDFLKLVLPVLTLAYLCFPGLTSPTLAQSLNDQIWQRIAVQDRVYEIHALTTTNIDNLTQRWLDMLNDEEVVSLYVKEEQGEVLKPENSKQLLIYAQSAGKLATTSTDPNVYLDNAALILETRNSRDSEGNVTGPYSVYGPKFTQSWWRHVFIYRGGATFTFEGLDYYPHRLNMYRQVLLDLVLQPEKQDAATAGYLNLLKGIEEVIKRLGLSSKWIELTTAGQNTIDIGTDFIDELDAVVGSDAFNAAMQEISPNLVTHLGELSSAMRTTLAILGTSLSIYNDASEYLFRQSLANALAQDRLEAIISLVNENKQNPELDPAFVEATLTYLEADFNLIRDSFYDNIPNVLEASVHAVFNNIVGLVTLSLKLVEIITHSPIVIGGLPISSVILPYYISYVLYQHLREETLDVQRLVLASTIHRFCFTSGYFDRFQENFKINQSRDLNYIRQALNLFNINMYAAEYVYTKYLVLFVSNIYGNPVTYINLWTIMDITTKFANEISLCGQAYVHTVRPYFLAWRYGDDFKYQLSERIEYEWLLSKLNVSTLSITANTDAPSYSPEDLVLLSVRVTDQYRTPIDGCLVTYTLTNSASRAITSGEAEPAGDGDYQINLTAPDHVDDYVVAIVASKADHYLSSETVNFSVVKPIDGHDVGVFAVSWDIESGFNPDTGDLVVEAGEAIRAEVVEIYNYGYYTENDVSVIMEVVDPNNPTMKVSSNSRSIGTIDPSESQLCGGALVIDSNKLSGLPNGKYELRIGTLLSNDSDDKNDAQIWQMYIGTPDKPSQQLPLQSYEYYNVRQTSPSKSMSTSLSVGGQTYDFTVEYGTNQFAHLTVSRGCSDYEDIVKQEFYPVCGGDVFVSLQGCSYFSSSEQYYLDLEIGIKSTDQNIQQDIYYQMVKKWRSGLCGSNHVTDESTKAYFDMYSESGQMEAWLIGYRPFLGPDIDSYINTWCFSRFTACGGYSGNYGGSLLDEKNLAAGRDDNGYLIVPSKNIPADDYNFVIIHRVSEPESSQTNPSDPHVIGYAHSIRIQVIDRHNLSLGSIQIPSSMQSGNNTYSITVPVTNNGDVDESNVTVYLNISNSAGNILSRSRDISIPTGSTLNVVFNWSTLGLSADTYHFEASARVNDDIDLPDNNSSIQEDLLPPPLLSVTGSLDKTSCAEGEQIALTATAQTGASVVYEITDSGASLIHSGSASDPENDGTYEATFTASQIPGTYTIEVVGRKLGYQEGSDLLTLTVNDTLPPTIPVLVSPYNGTFLNEVSPTMDWHDSIDIGSGTNGYEIQIDDNSDFSSPLASGSPSVSSFTIASSLPDGTYHWRVRSQDTAANLSDWSPNQSFAVDTEPPAVRITAPTDSSTYETNMPTLAIFGTASDNLSTPHLAWINDRGGEGACTGSISWSVSGIQLYPDLNLIAVSASDLAGNESSDTLMVTLVEAPEFSLKYGETEILDGSGIFDFGRVKVDSTMDAIFTIENLGSVNLNLTGSPPVLIEGINATSFFVTRQPTTSVPAGGAATFEITFIPSVGGKHTASILISNGDTDESPYDFIVTGTAIAGMPWLPLLLDD